MARRSPPRKVTYFEPLPPRLARNTIIESTFDVGRRFRCTMRIEIRVGQNRGQLGNLRLQFRDPGREQLERPLVIEIHATWRSTH